ncbi:MAG: ketoacyl-ACP synthase III [Neisseriaceae bacterium]|nr:ketoacyl-ACP synthase III [Neisseriaceae bacterium]MBP6861695.1 ketoacyl-ACP synthase III [Neisseriaceae bacterium]
MLPFKIIATGKALPTQQVWSTQLDEKLGLPRGYTAKKSGVDCRYFADDALLQSALGAEALRDACQRQDIDPASIDLLLCANGVPEQALPSTASRVLACSELRAGIAAFDVNASCVSFITALHQAACLLQAGAYRRIAIVSTEIASRGIDWADHETALIFGDGAAAVIVEAGAAGQGCAAYRLAVHPAGVTHCEIRAGGTRRNPVVGMTVSDHHFKMAGKRVFKLATQLMPEFLAELLAPLGLTAAQIDVVVPHQASHLSLHHVRARLGFSTAQVVDIYAHHGNQVAASIPTALHEAVQQGRLGPGQTVLLLGTAAGFGMAGMVLRT